MPGSSNNGSQPGGSGSGTGPGLSGYAPSYGIPGSGGYGYNTGAGLGGPAQAYRVPGGGGVGAAGFGSSQNAMGYGAITNVYGDTGLGGGGRYGNANRPSFGISGAGGNYGGFNRYGRYGHMTTGITLDRGTLPPSQPGEENVAHLRVVLPSKDAQLWVNDTHMKKKGIKRSFVSPFLTPGKRFIYDLQIRWTDRDGQEREESRSVMVRAGSQEIVDFTRPETSQTVSRLARELGLGRDR